MSDSDEAWNKALEERAKKEDLTKSHYTVDEKIDHKLNAAVIAINNKLNELTEINLNHREQLSYLRGYIKAVCLHVEQLENKIQRLK